MDLDMRHGSLFSGIGGFDLAAEWMGWENVFHCEWNEFGQRVLKYYWPNAISYADITKTDFTIHRGTIDILTGGFPCQPYSSAGKRLGKEDDRHLWPEMLRAIREIQPAYVVGENVRGLTNWNGGMVFDEVQADLETQGYEVTPFLLPACAVNAPHRRDRVWFVAYSECSRSQREIQDIRQIKSAIPKPSIQNGPLVPAERTELFRNDAKLRQYDGLPAGMDRKTFSKLYTDSIKAYGNAIVPQVAFEIFKAIEATI
jgi:DNA (cytosine-5)-methyltransferase 1